MSRQLHPLWFRYVPVQGRVGTGQPTDRADEMGKDFKQKFVVSLMRASAGTSLGAVPKGQIDFAPHALALTATTTRETQRSMLQLWTTSTNGCSSEQVPRETCGCGGLLCFAGKGAVQRTLQQRLRLRNCVRAVLQERLYRSTVKWQRRIPT